MPIDFNCPCGALLSADDSRAGLTVSCPNCNQVLEVPADAPLTAEPLDYARSGGTITSGPVASPRGGFVIPPDTIPPKLRKPGLPPCYLVFHTRGAHINASFDASPVLQSLADAFAKKLRKRYDVQIVQQAPPDAPSATIRLVQVDEGNRFLRYFLTFFAGKTILEIEGRTTNQTSGQQFFHETHKGITGVIGGSALGLLKVSGKALGTKVAKKLLK